MTYQCPACHKIFPTGLTIEIPQEIIIEGKEHLQDKRYLNWTGPYCWACYAHFMYQNIPKLQRRD